MAAVSNGSYVQPARNRLINDYNFYGYPTVFFDGGAEVHVGGTSAWGPYTSRINATGGRPVQALNFIVATRHMDNDDYEVRVRIGNGVPANNPPPEPDIPNGPDVGYPDSVLQFDCAVVDPDADDAVYYQWDFGDGQISDWIGPTSGGVPCQVSHTWTEKGTYNVIARTKDAYEETSSWSQEKSVYIRCCVVASDIDNSGDVNVADLTFLVDYLFRGGTPPECFEQADPDGSSTTNVADVSYLVDYLFRGGPAPVPCP